MAKAAADNINQHPDTSIFRNSKFWVGEGNVLPLTKYKVDGWHFANSIMVGSFTALVFSRIEYNLYLSFAVLEIEFILVFNLFYNKLFRIKGWKQ